MKIRKLKALLNTKHFVANYGDYIGIGTPVLHDAISIDADNLSITCKAVHFKMFVDLTNQVHRLKESGQLQDILEGDDNIANPLPVYSVKDGQLVEKFTDSFTWPSITHDGEPMYSNTHFDTPEAAIEAGLTECRSGLLLCTREITDLENRIATLQQRQAQYQAHISQLQDQQQERL